MQLAELVAASAQVAATRNKLDKVAALAACLTRLPPDQIEIGVAFLSGQTVQGRIGVGPALIREACGVGAATVAALDLLSVDRQLTFIADAAGPGSATRRARLLGELFSQATGQEQQFLARLLFGELRQGALEGLLVEAVARAAGLGAADVRRAAMLAGGLGPAARAALTEGKAGLARFSITPFRPVSPMLAQPAESVGEAIQELGEAALEWKLDGARVQIHKQGKDVQIFTRSLGDATAAVAEIVDVMRGAPANELILDGEVIALRADGGPHPFQVTMRRFGRKLDIAAMREELPLSVFAFDCLYRDGEALLDHRAEERFAALADSLPRQLLIPRLLTAEPVQAEAFFEDAVRRGHEGVMVKSLDAAYAAGSRGRFWLKVKPAQTLDLVVLAAEWGNGRRKGWLSNLHLGARDAGSGQFVMLGKTFKGMTDLMLAWQTEALLKLEVSRDAYTVYLRPELVVEIAFNELQASSRYPGGLALRFARVKRYRADKQAADADTISTVRGIFARQSGRRSALSA
jgi:DNA ligase 1